MTEFGPRRPLAGLALVLAAGRAPLGAQEGGPAPPPPSPVVVAEGLGQKLDVEASALAALGFNGSVLIAKDDKVILCKGYGLAQRETQRANTPDTLFDIASLTKQFTAAAILKLEEQGKLETSDRLSKFVGDVPKDKAAITLHHLLTHTSGLPREVLVASGTTERSDLIATALGTKLRSRPGAELCYSNANFELLGAVVEIASGQRFEDYVKQQLFAPAQLARTTFLQDPSVDAASAAYGQESRKVYPAQEGWYSWGLRGAGGVLSSVVELERWWRALEGGKVLSAASRKKLFTPRLLTYACGWRVREHDKFGQVIEHAGTTRGFESSLACYPDQDLLVIVLSNERQTCSSTSFALAMTAAGFDHGNVPVGVALAPETLQQCEGTFVAGKSGEVVVSLVGARLALELSPEAVVLLSTGREAKTLSRDPKKTERIERIVEQMRAGDSAALSPLVAKDSDLDRSLVRTWREWVAEQGAFERCEVLGTHRASDYLEAFVRLDFDAGCLVAALLFRDELLAGYEIGGGLPRGAAFVARSATEFAWLDPTSHGSKSCQLLVERDAKGRVTMLTIKSLFDTLQARRKK